MRQAGIAHKAAAAAAAEGHPTSRHRHRPFQEGPSEAPRRENFLWGTKGLRIRPGDRLCPGSSTGPPPLPSVSLSRNYKAKKGRKEETPEKEERTPRRAKEK